MSDIVLGVFILAGLVIVGAFVLGVLFIHEKNSVSRTGSYACLIKPDGTRMEMGNTNDFVGPAVMRPDPHLMTVANMRFLEKAAGTDRDRISVTDEDTFVLPPVLTDKEVQKLLGRGK